MTVSVAVRLGLEGGQAATRGVEEFGNKGQRSFRDIRKEAAALPPHLVAVSRGVSAIKDKVEDLAGSTGALGNVAGSFGTYGLAAAAAVAVVTAGVLAFREAALAAIEFADEIDGAAQRAGVNTDTLQELRYAVKMTGGEYADADAAIGSFTKTLGQAESGNAKALKAFRQLGFSQQDLKSFKSADDALISVSRSIAGLEKETERQAIADKLGIPGLIPVLREGADRFSELRDRAHEVGAVMDGETTKRAGELQDRLDELSAKIKNEMNSAFVDAGPLVVSVAEGLGDGATGAANFFREISDGLPALSSFLDKVPLLKSYLEFAGKAAWNITPFPWIGRGVDALGASGRAKSLGTSVENMLNGGLGKMKLVDGEWVAADAPAPVRNGQLADLSSGDGGARKSADAARMKRELEQARKEAEKLELATRQAAGAAIDYADATKKGVAEVTGDASTLDYLERVKAYYADLNGLLKAGVDLLDAKVLVQDRILAQAKAEMKARSNPEGFVAAADGIAKALEGAVITAPEMDFDWLRLGAGDAFHDGLMAAAENGDFFEAFEARLRYAAASALAGQLTNALFAKSSDGGWLGKLASAAVGALGGSFGSPGVSAASAADLGGANLAARLGAGRAGGGPVYGGDIRPIHEYGFERLGRFSGDGYMHDAARTAREITDQNLSARSAYNQPGGGAISVSLNNASPMPLAATARETDDGMGGRKVEIDIVELMDQRVSRGQRELFGGGFDSAFQNKFGVRPRLNGG